jgi:hypothetical protein
MKGPGEKVIDGEISWSSDREMRFIPASPLEPDSRYSVTVSTDAASEEGVELIEPALLEFSTSGVLQVSQVFPTPDTNNVSNDAIITVIFNRPVVPLGIAEEESKLPQPVTITPPTSGKGEWVNTSIYAFNRINFDCRYDHSIIIQAAGRCSRGHSSQRFFLERRLPLRIKSWSWAAVLSIRRQP